MVIIVSLFVSSDVFQASEKQTATVKLPGVPVALVAVADGSSFSTSQDGHWGRRITVP